METNTRGLQDEGSADPDAEDLDESSETWSFLVLVFWVNDGNIEMYATPQS